jgi:hypothetical protein
MNNEPVLNPIPRPGSFGGGGGSFGGPLMFILIAVLGLGAIIFALLTVHFYTTAHTATTTLNAQKAAAAQAAEAQQKKVDDVAYTKAGESPFRAFTAPDSDGSFVINFPKDWSSFVDEEQTGTQVTLILNPNFVTRSNGDPNDPAAAVITLQEQTSSEFMGQFTGDVQEGQMHQTPVTVSGQPGYNLTGTFSDNSGTVREVVIPVRDKVLVFQNENSSYASEFNEILAQAKINP